MLIAAVCVGCASVEVLEPAHKMALENQRNFEDNLNTVLNEYARIARSHPDYEAEKDEPEIVKHITTLRGHLAIASTYIALVDAYINGCDINEETFQQALKQLPKMIIEGRKVLDDILRFIKEGK